MSKYGSLFGIVLGLTHGSACVVHHALQLQDSLRQLLLATALICQLVLALHGKVS